MTTWQNIINGFGEPRRALVLGPLLVSVNALLIWTLGHTDIVAFVIVFVFSSLIVFAIYQLLSRALSSTYRIDGQESPTDRSEEDAPQRAC
jgi:predicted MFS family arabinose efflux permease